MDTSELLSMDSLSDRTDTQAGDYIIYGHYLLNDADTASAYLLPQTTEELLMILDKVGVLLAPSAADKCRSCSAYRIHKEE